MSNEFLSGRKSGRNSGGSVAATATDGTSDFKLHEVWRAKQQVLCRDAAQESDTRGMR